MILQDDIASNIRVTKSLSIPRVINLPEPYIESKYRGSILYHGSTKTFYGGADHWVPLNEDIDIVNIGSKENQVSILNTNSTSTYNIKSLYSSDNSILITDESDNINVQVNPNSSFKFLQTEYTQEDGVNLKVESNTNFVLPSYNDTNGNGTMRLPIVSDKPISAPVSGTGSIVYNNADDSCYIYDSLGVWRSYTHNNLAELNIKSSSDTVKIESTDESIDINASIDIVTDYDGTNPPNSGTYSIISRRTISSPGTQEIGFYPIGSSSGNVIIDFKGGYANGYIDLDVNIPSQKTVSLYNIGSGNGILNSFVESPNYTFHLNSILGHTLSTDNSVHTIPVIHSTNTVNNTIVISAHEIGSSDNSIVVTSSNDSSGTPYIDLSVNSSVALEVAVDDSNTVHPNVDNRLNIEGVLGLRTTGDTNTIKIMDHRYLTVSNSVSSNSFPDLSNIDKEYTTIQHAINASTELESPVILIQPGIYIENLHIGSNRNITLIGVAHDSKFSNNTTIQGIISIGHNSNVSFKNLNISYNSDNDTKDLIESDPDTTLDIDNCKLEQLSTNMLHTILNVSEPLLIHIHNSRIIAPNASLETPISMHLTGNNNTVNNCKFTDSYFEGIEIKSDEISLNIINCNLVNSKCIGMNDTNNLYSLNFYSCIFENSILINMAGGTDGNSIKIQDCQFNFDGSYNTAIIQNASTYSSRETFVIHNTNFNLNNIHQFLYLLGDSITSFQDCTFNIHSNYNGSFFLTEDTTHLILRGCSFYIDYEMSVNTNSFNILHIHENSSCLSSHNSYVINIHNDDTNVVSFSNKLFNITGNTLDFENSDLQITFDFTDPTLNHNILFNQTNTSTLNILRSNIHTQNCHQLINSEDSNVILNANEILMTWNYTSLVSIVSDIIQFYSNNDTSFSMSSSNIHTILDNIKIDGNLFKLISMNDSIITDNNIRVNGSGSIHGIYIHENSTIISSKNDILVNLDTHTIDYFIKSNHTFKSSHDKYIINKINQFIINTQATSPLTVHLLNGSVHIDSINLFIENSQFLKIHNMDVYINGNDNSLNTLIKTSFLQPDCYLNITNSSFHINHINGIHITDCQNTPNHLYSFKLENTDITFSNTNSSVNYSFITLPILDPSKVTIDSTDYNVDIHNCNLIFNGTQFLHSNNTNVIGTGVSPIPFYTSINNSTMVSRNLHNSFVSYTHNTNYYSPNIILKCFNSNINISSNNKTFLVGSNNKNSVYLYNSNITLDNTALLENMSFTSNSSKIACNNINLTTSIINNADQFILTNTELTYSTAPYTGIVIVDTPIIQNSNSVEFYKSCLNIYCDVSTNEPVCQNPVFYNIHHSFILNDTTIHELSNNKLYAPLLSNSNCNVIHLINSQVNGNFETNGLFNNLSNISSNISILSSIIDTRSNGLLSMSSNVDPLPFVNILLSHSQITLLPNMVSDGYVFNNTIGNITIDNCELEYTIGYISTNSNTQIDTLKITHSIHNGIINGNFKHAILTHSTFTIADKCNVELQSTETFVSKLCEFNATQSANNINVTGLYKNANLNERLSVDIRHSTFISNINNLSTDNVIVDTPDPICNFLLDSNTFIVENDSNHNLQPNVKISHGTSIEGTTHTLFYSEYIHVHNNTFKSSHTTPLSKLNIPNLVIWTNNKSPTSNNPKPDVDMKITHCKFSTGDHSNLIIRTLFDDLVFDDTMQYIGSNRVISHCHFENYPDNSTSFSLSDSYPTLTYPNLEINGGSYNYVDGQPDPYKGPIYQIHYCHFETGFSHDTNGSILCISNNPNGLFESNQKSVPTSAIVTNSSFGSNSIENGENGVYTIHLSLRSNEDIVIPSSIVISGNSNSHTPELIMTRPGRIGGISPTTALYYDANTF